jgi:hypothetical protein
VDSTEPSPTDATMNGRGRVARFIHRGNSLTGPLKVRPGFCLILLLQHKPLHAVKSYSSDLDDYG